MALDMGKVGKLLSNPWVLAGGAVVALLLIFLARRGAGGTPSTAADYTLSSQALATQANVAMSGDSLAYNTAALQYNAAIAGTAAQVKVADINGNTAIDLASIATLQNAENNAAQIDLTRTVTAGSVAQTDAQYGAYIDAAKIAANTEITLAPEDAALATTLAQTGSAEAITLANINASAATNIANTQAAAAVKLGELSLISSSTHDFTTGNTSLFNTVGNMVGGSSSTTSPGGGSNVSGLASLASLFG